MNTVVQIQPKDVGSIPYQEASYDIWDKKYRLIAKDGSPVDRSMDDTYKRALAAGAKSLSQPRDQFYGERSAGLIDDWGNHWYIATYTEDLTPEELSARAATQGESSH